MLLLYIQTYAVHLIERERDYIDRREETEHRIEKRERDYIDRREETEHRIEERGHIYRRTEYTELKRETI